MLNWVRSVARRVLPGKGEAGWVEKEARSLLSRSAGCRTLEEKVDLMLGNPAFFALQKRSEILGLLRMVEALEPRLLCEIGSQQGGTLFLLAQVAPDGAKIFSLDIEHTPACLAIAEAAGTRTPVTCLTADSHSPETLAKVRDWLGGGELFDFMLIDGDHSLAGVKQDHEMYSPLARPGGLIAFHDINPLKPGVEEPTGADPGEVPEFWAGFKPTQTDVTEFVEDPTRGGYGIGVARVPEGTHEPS